MAKDNFSVKRDDKKILDRLLSHVQKSDDPDKCWIWIGSKTKAGAGIFALNRTHTTAHRAIYLLTRGEVSSGKRVTRVCKNVACVNPNHLELEEDPRQKTTEQRFWEKVDVRGEDECWDWLGVKGGKKLNRSYGHFSVGKIRIKSHRFSWELKHGVQVPSGVEVCHKCDRPCCVNPNHLFLGTHTENMLDMVQKGRSSASGDLGRGERNRFAKLTEVDVRKIRSLYCEGMKQVEIARLYNMTQPGVSAIILRKNWGHVD